MPPIARVLLFTAAALGGLYDVFVPRLPANRVGSPFYMPLAFALLTLIGVLLAWPR
jgi:drug/metabolite transporter (DMT)-like permease